MGIGTTVPDGKLHLWTATAGAVTAHANGDNLILEDGGNVGLTFLSPDSSAQFIYFGAASEHKRGHIEYNHCDDYISMGTANNANLRIDCAGNVGIGTTAPDTLLQLGASEIGGAARLYQSFGVACTEGSLDYNMTLADNTAQAEGTGAGIRFNGRYNDSAGSNAGAGGIDIYKEDGSSGNYGFSLRFHARANGAAITEKMRITGAGNVGIGITAPGNQLEIAKSAGEAIMELSSWSTTDSDQPLIIFQKSASATIGTMAATADGEILGSQHYHGVNSSSATTSAARIQIEQDGAAGATYVPGRIMFKTGTDAVGVTDRMTIDSGGFVGIGTDDPTYPLHLVTDTANDYAVFLKNDNADGSGLRIRADDTDDDEYLLYMENSTTVRFTVMSGGNVGIGTAAPTGTLNVVTSNVAVTPDTDADELVVENSGRSGISILSSDASSGKLIFGTPSDAAGASIAWNHDSDLMTLGTNNAGASLAFNSANGAEAVRIDSSGNVGIGTAAPANPVDVTTIKWFCRYWRLR